MAPLQFTIGLTINVSADNVVLDNYVAPTIREGILLETTIPINLVKQTFVYLTETPTVNLLDSLQNVQYTTLKRNIGTVSVPNYSYDNVIPNVLNLGFTLPSAAGYKITDFTTPLSTNKTMEYDLLQFIAVHILHSDVDIATATAAVDKKLPSPSSAKLSDTVTGIINSGDFRKKILDKIKLGFSTKLNDYGLVAGEGSVYLSTPPTDPATGALLDFNPALEITRCIFNFEPSRLAVLGTPIADAAAAGVNVGKSAFGVSVEAGDILDFNIVVTTTQVSKSDTTIGSRTYRIRAVIVA